MHQKCRQSVHKEQNMRVRDKKVHIHVAAEMPTMCKEQNVIIDGLEVVDFPWKCQLCRKLLIFSRTIVCSLIVYGLGLFVGCCFFPTCRPCTTYRLCNCLWLSGSDAAHALLVRRAYHQCWRVRVPFPSGTMDFLL